MFEKWNKGQKGRWQKRGPVERWRVAGVSEKQNSQRGQRMCSGGKWSHVQRAKKEKETDVWPRVPGGSPALLLVQCQSKKISVIEKSSSSDLNVSVFCSQCYSTSQVRCLTPLCDSPTLTHLLSAITTHTSYLFLFSDDLLNGDKHPNLVLWIFQLIRPHLRAHPVLQPVPPPLRG